MGFLGSSHDDDNHPHDHDFGARRPPRRCSTSTGTCSGYTVQGLSDEAARSHPTVSALSLGGLIKHVTKVEDNWASFIVDGPVQQPTVDWETIDWSNPPASVRAHLDSFQMREDETLAELLAAYDEVAEATDALLANPDLDLDHRQALPGAAVVRAGRVLVGSSGLRPHHRRDRPARRPRRHHPRDHRRPEVDGLSRGPDSGTGRLLR